MIIHLARARIHTGKRGLLLLVWAGRGDAIWDDNHAERVIVPREKNYVYTTREFFSISCKRYCSPWSRQLRERIITITLSYFIQISTNPTKNNAINRYSSAKIITFPIINPFSKRQKMNSLSLFSEKLFFIRVYKNWPKRKIEESDRSEPVSRSEMSEVTNGRQSNYLSEVVSFSVAGKRYSGSPLLSPFPFKEQPPSPPLPFSSRGGKTNNAKTPPLSRASTSLQSTSHTTGTRGHERTLISSPLSYPRRWVRRQLRTRPRFSPPTLSPLINAASHCQFSRHFLSSHRFSTLTVGTVTIGRMIRS